MCGGRKRNKEEEQDLKKQRFFNSTWPDGFPLLETGLILSRHGHKLSCNKSSWVWELRPTINLEVIFIPGPFSFPHPKLFNIFKSFCSINFSRTATLCHLKYRVTGSFWRSDGRLKIGVFVVCLTLFRLGGGGGGLLMPAPTLISSQFQQHFEGHV